MSDLIDFRCPHCNQRLGAKKETSGGQTTCPNCKGTVKIPDTAKIEQVLAVATVMNAPIDSTRRTSANESQTNSSAGLSDIRLQIGRGVVFPANTTFRDAIKDLYVFGSCLWGFLICVFCVVAVGTRLISAKHDKHETLAEFQIRQQKFAAGVGLNNDKYVPSTDLDFWDYAAVFGYVTVAIAVFSGGIAMALFLKCGEIRADRRINAERIADAVRRRAESHFAALRSLAPLLDAANRHLDEAIQRFQENAFGPFWDSIQEAVRTLDAFRHSANEVRGEYDEYHHTLSGYSHTFPVLPRYGDQLPNPISALQRLDQAVRLGQTNFQFATIWEQRRTREAVLVGFDTWADAVSQIAARVLSSFKAFA